MGHPRLLQWLSSVSGKNDPSSRGVGRLHGSGTNTNHAEGLAQAWGQGTSLPLPSVPLGTPRHHLSCAPQACLRTLAYTVLAPCNQTPRPQRQVLCQLLGSTDPSPKGHLGPRGIRALLDDAEGSLLKAGGGRGETPGERLLQDLHAPLTVLCQLFKSARKRAPLRSLLPGVGCGQTTSRGGDGGAYLLVSAMLPRWVNWLEWFRHI